MVVSTADDWYNKEFMDAGERASRTRVGWGVFI
jgi:hypothetical protein